MQKRNSKIHRLFKFQSDPNRQAKASHLLFLCALRASVFQTLQETPQDK